MAFVKPNPERLAQLSGLIDDVQRKYWAFTEARREYETAEAALKRGVGPDHEHSSNACRVNKIGGCIYPPYPVRNIGKRACILCGNDDWSE